MAHEENMERILLCYIGEYGFTKILHVLISQLQVFQIRIATPPQNLQSDELN